MFWPHPIHLQAVKAQHCNGLWLLKDDEGCSTFWARETLHCCKRTVESSGLG